MSGINNHKPTQPTALQDGQQDWPTTRPHAAAEASGSAGDIPLDRFTIPDAQVEAPAQSRRTLDPDERWVESRKNQAALDRMQATCAGTSADADVVHKHYHGIDAPIFSTSGQRKDECREFKKAMKAQGFIPAKGWSLSTIDDTQPPATKWLQVSYGLCSQVPYIKLLVDLAPNGARVMVHLFASNMRHDLDGTGAFSSLDTSPAGRESLQYMVENSTLLSRQEHIKQMAKDNHCIWFGMRLLTGDRKDIEGRPSRIHISGDVALGNLQLWSERVKAETSDSIPEGMTPQEAFLGALFGGQTEILELVVLESTQKNVDDGPKQIGKFAKWFTTVMHLSIKHGNCWWYRMQQPDIDWQSWEFPFNDMDPPRWLVTEWKPRQHSQPADYSSQQSPEADVEGAVLHGEQEQEQAQAGEESEDVDLRVRPAQPAVWHFFKFASAWPGEEEFRFFVRLGVFRENDRRLTELNELVRQERTRLRAHIERNPFLQGSWHVSITGGIEHAKLRRAMANNNYAITVVFPYREHRPVKAVMVDDASNQPGDITLAVSNVTTLFETAPGQPLRVLLRFEPDVQTFLRHMETLHKLRAPPESRTEGVDMAHFIMGINRMRTTDPAAYQNRWLEDNRHTGFMQKVREFGLTPEQEWAAQSAFTSANGATIIEGPPGTGKTRLLVVKIHALLSQRLKVIVTAPTNATRDAFAKAWLDHIQDEVERKRERESSKPESQRDTSEPFGGNWCIFKSMYMHSDRRYAQYGGRQDGEEQMSAEDAAYWRFFNMQINEPDLLGHKRYAFAVRRQLFAQHLANIGTPGAREYLDMIRNHVNLDDNEKRHLLRLDAEFSGYYIANCPLVFVTNSTSAHPVLAKSFRPDVIISDEAGLATIVDAATPLMAYKDVAKVVVLAGDSKQQSPICLSATQNEAVRLTEKSILEHLQDNNSMIVEDERYTIAGLKEQYRMHPDIVAFPNRQFYQGELLNAPVVSLNGALDDTLERLFAGTAGYFGGRVVRRIGIDERSTPSDYAPGSYSLINEAEVDVVCRLVNTMITFPVMENQRAILASDILILSPYSGQVRQIRASLHDPRIVDERAQGVRVMTSASAQGSEAEIVIVSLVVNRPEQPRNVGFISDNQQICVESTRAKRLCIFVGAFSLWLDASHRREMLGNRSRPLTNLVHDFYSSRQLITTDDLYKAMDRTAEPLLRKDTRFWQMPPTQQQQGGSRKRQFEPDEESVTMVGPDGRMLGPLYPGRGAASRGRGPGLGAGRRGDRGRGRGRGRWA